jgi:hypothetical protein
MHYVHWMVREHLKTMFNRIISDHLKINCFGSSAQRQRGLLVSTIIRNI